MIMHYDGWPPTAGFRIPRHGRLRGDGSGHPAGVSSFDRVVIIFNPQSTGNAPESAEELRDDLRQRLPAVPLELSPTQHAGHAWDLARKAAVGGRPLIVSV